MITTFALLIQFSLSASGKTTRYWDCCKESCGWTGKASVSHPVFSCDKNNNNIQDFAAKSACDGGTAYACASHAPRVVNSNLSYGFAAVKLAGSSESQWCCQCYELTFTDGAASGKKFVVQAVNTGGDLGDNHFDLLIPGGGVGIYNACSDQYNAPADGWGSRYGGVSSRDQCSQLPSSLQAGCQWRWDFLNGADNPSVSFNQVTCPSELTSISGCTRN
jgi:hypothetical protein